MIKVVLNLSSRLKFQLPPSHRKINDARVWVGRLQGCRRYLYVPLPADQEVHGRMTSSLDNLKLATTAPNSASPRFRHLNASPAPSVSPGSSDHVASSLPVAELAQPPLLPFPTRFASHNLVTGCC